MIINDGHKMSFTNDKRPLAFDQDVNINAAIHLRDAVSTLFSDVTFEIFYTHEVIITCRRIIIVVYYVVRLFLD